LAPCPVPLKSSSFISYYIPEGRGEEDEVKRVEKSRLIRLKKALTRPFEEIGLPSVPIIYCPNASLNNPLASLSSSSSTSQVPSYIAEVSGKFTILSKNLSIFGKSMGFE